MRSDKSIHLATAAKRRHELTRAKAIAALHELDRAGKKITFESVSDTAGVSRSWLYTQTDLKDEIQRIRAATSRQTSPRPRAGSAPPTTPCASAWISRCAATANSPKRTSGCAVSSPTPSANSATPHPEHVTIR
jgi:Family of unknown function (DUF6262)